MRLVALAMWLAAGAAAAQPCSTELIESVISGRRSYDALNQEGQACLRWYLAVQRGASRCGQTVPKYCRELCESAEQLQSAADDLARCAGRNVPSDDCSRQYRSVRDAFNEHEIAVSERGADCS